MNNLRVATYDKNWLLSHYFPSSLYDPILCGRDTGTYPGASAVHDDPDYPAENLLTPDRNQVCRIPPSYGSAEFDFDMGGNRTVEAIGAFGVRRYGDSFFPSTISVSWKDPADVRGWGAPWGLLGSLSVKRDSFLYLGGAVVVRYLKFSMTNVNMSLGVTLGKFFAGTLVDLGGVAPSIGRTYHRFRSRVATPAGVTFTRELANGEMSGTLTYPLRQLTVARLAVIRGLYDELYPFIVQDPSGDAFECDVSGSDYGESAPFNDSQGFRADLDLALEALL